ncbi:hypothetical protein F0U61_40830 [Archangium violaceum]|uniref:hypothetical protein n=1 Tax=Archangium violaceum TaxID=83451 RepID=UPI002B28163A|nr:hypothetical protein F0U61_40830 [Archangium violaceum]
MFITRASPQLLGTRRIDPDYYAPVHVADEQRLRQFGSFELGECGRFFVGPFGSELPSSLYRPSGVPLLRVGNIGQLDMSEDNLVFLDEATHKQLEASETLPGDLLIVKASVGEKICRFPTRYDRGNITQHIIGIRPNGYADMDYVAVALFSPIGRRQLERRSLGSIIQYLGVVDARTVLVPRIAPDAQRYIGDKVRQADRLRERARRLEAESSAFFQLQEWTEPRAGTRRAYTARRGAMRSERLDAPFYDPGHEDLDALLRRRGDIELSEVASLVEARWKRGGDRFSYFEIGELDIGSGILTPTTTEVAAAPSRAQILVEPWDVLVSTVRPNRKNVGLVLPSDDSLALVASTGFAVLRFENAANAAFYHSFLRSDAATQQLMRWNSGATYPAIESDVPLRVRAPHFDGEVVQREGRRWLEKFSALSASRGLTLVATTLVERLMDGRITEADLVATQKALESGDRSADREILKALRQSDAPDAKPLIADVDALYALLDASEGQNA